MEPPAGAPDAERRTVGVEEAVLGRVAALPPEARAAWTERFAELAAAELASAGASPRLLAGVERRNPATPAAGRAALALADRELERGDLAAAAAWAARARRHAELARESAPQVSAALSSAADARARAAAELEPRDTTFEDTWDGATGLRPLARIDLGGRPVLGERPGEVASGPPVGVTPGLAFLPDGRVAVQTAERVWLVSPTGRELESSFEPTRLLPRALLVRPPALLPGDDRHWPLVPRAAGGNLLVVHGRSLPFEEPNALALLHPPSPPPAPGLSKPGVPDLVWAVVGSRRVDRAGEVSDDPLLAEFERAEVQPGPLVIGSRAIVQLRRYEDEVRAWLAAFDLGTGECLWLRLLAQGTAAFSGEFRSAAPLRASVPAPPLAAAGTAVLAATGLGAAVLVDAADGRVLWSFENRRRGTGGPGWRTAAPPAPAPSPAGDAFVWAPQDSDRLYRLAGRALPGSASPLLAAPGELGEGIALAGADGEATFLLARSGARRVLASLAATDGARLDSPYLGAGETFGGPVALTPRRAAFATDRGLYLLDRERELYLLAYGPLSSGGAPPDAGGAVLARGARLFVLGPEALWTFLAE